jgi:hypothetical protein
MPQIRGKFLQDIARLLSPLLAVSIFAGAYVFYYKAAGVGQVDAGYLRNPENGIEFFYRIMWFVSSIATALAASLVMAVSTRFTHNLLNVKDSLWLYGACAVPLVVVLLLLRNHDMSGGAGMAFVSQIDHTVGLAADPAVEITMGLAVIAIFLLVVNACALIAKSQKNVEVHTIAECYTNFRICLISASFFLVVGTLNIAALYKWAAHVPQDSGVAPIVADGLAVGGGVVYSVLLLTIFLPVSLVLDQRVDLLVSREVTSEDPEDVDRWLKRHGLFNSPARVTGRYLLIAAPMLVGAVIDAFLPLVRSG